MTLDPLNIRNRTDLRGVATITLLGLLVGSWGFFLWKVPIDPDTPIDGNVLVMMFGSMIVGSIIGMFNWLGFRQGQNVQQFATPATPPISDEQLRRTITPILENLIESKKLDEDKPVEPEATSKSS
jgi:hypothetical protein